jgi:pilus assembly protein CpaB
MTRGRRALLLIGLALLLGTLAASDVAGREADLRRSLEPVVDVVVARGEIRAGAVLRLEQLRVRRVPARYAPAVAIADPTRLDGLRAAVTIEPGSDVTQAQLLSESVAAVLRPGERIVDLVAAGSPRLILTGTRVDVLVTRESGGTTLALEGAEVMAATSAQTEEGSAGPRVQASLRVTVRQAVYLTAAQSFAREIRLLPRAAGERRSGVEGTAVGTDLR